MRYTCTCGKTLSGTAQHCVASASCHETFVGTVAGDAHRVGPHDGDRRCLTPAEMLAHPKREFRRDARGYWHLGPPDDRWNRTESVYVPSENAQEPPSGTQGHLDPAEALLREIFEEPA